MRKTRERDDKTGKAEQHVGSSKKDGEVGSNADLAVQQKRGMPIRAPRLRVHRPPDAMKSAAEGRGGMRENAVVDIMQ